MPASRKQLFLLNLPSGLSGDEDPIASRLLSEYGAVFTARNGATPPDRIIFRTEEEVSTFQASVEIESIELGGFTIELQAAAARALRDAAQAANDVGLSITPRGADSGRRSYAETVELWHSRVEPALVHWVEKGALERADADRIRSLSPFEQVPVVLELESRGIFFSKDLSKSIAYSVAPPGTSQHLSMLAFDVREFDDPVVRKALADHYWHQTVVSDLPHFTYLGMNAAELEKVGLKLVEHADRHFWLPDI